MSQINIVIIDEFEDLIQKSSGILDLESGIVSNIMRNKNDHTKPWKAKDYSFTSGLLKLGSKELEFAIEINKNEEYQVSVSELNEIKQKLSNLMKKTKRPKM